MGRSGSLLWPAPTGRQRVEELVGAVRLHARQGEEEARRHGRGREDLGQGLLRLRGHEEGVSAEDFERRREPTHLVPARSLAHDEEPHPRVDPRNLCRESYEIVNSVEVTDRRRDGHERAPLQPYAFGPEPVRYRMVDLNRSMSQAFGTTETRPGGTPCFRTPSAIPGDSATT